MSAMTQALRNFGAPSLAKAFSEEDHPRDANGRWTSGDHAVDNSVFQPEDEARMHAIDARHVAALKRLGATVEKEHAKAYDALAEHNAVLDEYGFEDSESTDVDDADDLRSGIDDALDVPKPHVTPAKLK